MFKQTYYDVNHIWMAGRQGYNRGLRIRVQISSKDIILKIQTIYKQTVLTF